MSIELTGLFTPPAPETRSIAYLNVQHNGQTYDWLIYVPQDVSVGEYVTANEAAIYAQIDAKEAQWDVLDPKTRTITDPFTDETITVDIQKSEIVHPDSPDYYALRRAEYPSIGDQLGAIAKGLNSAEYLDIQAKIAAVKSKYPKP
jgi:hypothetical protein